MPQNDSYSRFLKLKDGAYLYFGDGNDANFYADGTGATFTGALDITGDVTITGDLDISTEDIFVDVGKYIWLDGETGTEYIRAVTDGNVIVNGATTAALGIGNTAVITVASATATFAQKIVQDDATNSTSKANGSIQTDGGLGVTLNTFLGGTLTIGTSGAGETVTFYGDNANSNFVWAEAGDTNGSLTLGATEDSVDFRVYGATAATYLHWDGGADDLILVGTATTLDVQGTLTASSTTAASLKTAGGLGVAGTSFFGGLLTADGGIDIGTVATGIDFTGTYTGNCIDFTDITIDHTGSAGPCMIRAGTYGDPATTTFVENTDTDQSGMIRLYGATSATTTNYDRGIFVCLVTTGTKGIFPIAGLAEVRDQSGNGPIAVMGAQFICDLHTTGAKLAALSGVGGMYGAWLKITAIDGATCSATARAAPIWLDNQLYGNNAGAIGEEYTIFSTTGGSKPKAWASFETSSSGWSNFLHFDETSYDQLPIVSAEPTGSTKKYLAVDLNGTAYGIPLNSVA